MFKVIDTHTHFDAEEVDEDRAEVFARAKEAGVGKVFLPAIDVKTTHAVLALAKEYPGYAYPMIGLHPEEVKADWKEQLAELRKILEEHRMTGNACQEGGSPQFSDLIAIGEVGLDYYWMDSSKEEQKKFFKAQIELAKKLDMPIIVHDRDAHGDTLDILRETKPKGVVHCFSGSKEMAREIIKLGMYIGLNGVVTFNNARKSLEVAKEIPIERLVLETDCPYLAPTPMRSKRNDSHYIPYIAEKIASLLDMDAQELLNITNENAKKLYNL